VGRVEKNLYWVTDSAYQAAFLTTRDGVVLFDAPPSIGHNLQRAIDKIAAENGVSNKVTHLVYSHHPVCRAGPAGAPGVKLRRRGQRRSGEPYMFCATCACACHRVCGFPSFLWLARTPWSWLRELMASLVKTLCR
jgi:hypothetical protein